MANSTVRASKPGDTSSSTLAIIGAGPVGLYTALLVAKAGIDVHVFEAENGILPSPRAIAYFPVVLEEFKKAGIYEDVLKAGPKNRDGVAWRKPGERAPMAEIKAHEEHFAVFLGQHELAEIILDHLKRLPNATIHFGCQLLQIEQSETSVTALFERTAEDRDAKFKHVSHFLVGADGGRSTVRKQIGVTFDGFTWGQFTLVAANITYELDKHTGWGSANFVVDPDIWAVVARTGKGNAWRVATPMAYDIDDNSNDWDAEAVEARLRERLRRILPGPTEDVVVRSLAPYKMHQRVASKFVVGNIVLAGDAAHVTNPVGGLGLTGGLLDAALLGRVLKRILLDQEETREMLDWYAETRRAVFVEVINPTAIDNLLRLYSTDPNVVQSRQEFFQRLNQPDIGFIMGMVEKEMGISSTRNI